MPAWLLTVTLALAAPAPGGDDPATIAEVRQEILPALLAQTAGARARITAAEAFFAGNAPLAEAFPDLARGPLLDAGALAGHRAALTARGRTRALERTRALPPGLDARSARELVSATATAMDAEDEADALRLRAILAIEGLVARAPGLSDAAVQPMIERWRQERDAIAALDDPSADALARLVVLTDAERLLEELRAVAVLSALVPGSPTVDDAVRTLIASPPEDPLAREAWLDRLDRVAPLVADDLAAAITAQSTAARLAQLDAALEAARAELATPPPLPDGADALEAAIPGLEAAAEAARAAVPAEADGDVAEREAALAVVRAERAEQVVAAARAALEAHRAAEVEDLGQSAEAAAEKADAARQAADQARAAAEAERSALTQLKLALAEHRETFAALLEEDAARRAAALTELEALEARLAALSEEASVAMALPPLDGTRYGRIDTAYADLRTLVNDLYQRMEALRGVNRMARADAAARLADARRAADAVGGGSPELDALGQEWTTAIADLSAALDARAHDLRSEEDAAYALLERARAARRRVRSQATSSARAAARGAFVPELVHELQTVPGHIVSGGRTLAGVIRSVPALLLDLNALWAFVWRSIELFVVAGLWWFGGVRASVWAPALWRAAEERTGSPVPASESELEPVVRLARRSLDLVGGWLLLAWLTPRVPALGLLALVWVLRATWRGAPLLAHVLLATPQEPRLALRAVTPETRERAAWTLQVWATWFTGVRLADYVARRLLDTDRLAELFGVIGWLVALPLLTVALVRWGPTVRDVLARDPDPNRITRYLSVQHQASEWLQAPLTLAGAAVAAFAAAARWGNQLVENRAGLRWLQSALARRQVATEEDADDSPLDVPAIATAEVPRAAELDALCAEEAAWAADRRQGLVAVVGPRGSGLAGVIDGFAARTDAPVVRWEPTDRLDTPERALAGLAEACGVPPCADADALVAALGALPSRRIVVAGAERMFLRVVGGSAPLRAVVDVLAQVDDHHFAVVVMHATTWGYLGSIVSSVRLDAFRRTIRLAELSGQELQAWLQSAADDAGIDLIWDRLAGAGPDHPDHAARVTKARAAYFRLLADSTSGNPAVARDLFHGSLRQADTPSTARVRMFRAPQPGEIAGLHDESLLVLLALDLHARASLGDLSAALNRREAEVASRCRHLADLGVAQRTDPHGEWRVQLAWQPAVTRLLRQKHFLHWSV